jgi:hypothetical protein
MEDPDVFLKAYVEKHGDVLAELIDALVSRGSLGVHEGIRLMLKRDVVEEEINKKANTEKVLNRLKNTINKYLSRKMLNEHTLYTLYEDLKIGFDFLLGEDLTFEAFQNWLQT